MSEEERLLVRLGQLLAQIARPHPVDAALPREVQVGLKQVGVVFDEATPREDLVARLWARKRTVLGITPPSAA